MPWIVPSQIIRGPRTLSRQRLISISRLDKISPPPYDPPMRDAQTAGSSRLRILAHIKKHGQASIADLSRDLDLTQVTVRHHVDALSRQGLICQGSFRRKRGPGRPEAVFHPTPLASGLLPRSYGELSGSLIAELAASMPSEELEAFLVLAARRLAASHLPPKARLFGDRLRHLSAFLEAKGYLPSVQALHDHLLVRFANCPYLEVASQVPSLCRFDVEFLRVALGCEVRLEARITSDESGCRLRAAAVVDAMAHS